MIWHLYENNSNDDKVIMTDSSDQMVHQYRSFTNNNDAKKTSFTSPNSQALFLNFTSNPSNTKKAKEKYITIKKASTSPSLLPATATTKAKAKAKAKATAAAVKVNGVNILNRKNVDSKTVVDRIQKRRENHNHVERRRRNCINHTITELSRVVPLQEAGQKLNKHNVLKSALDHILVS